MFIAIEKHVFFPCFIQLKLCCSTRIIPNRVNLFNPAKEKNATRAEGGNHSQSALRMITFSLKLSLLSTWRVGSLKVVSTTVVTIHCCTVTRRQKSKRLLYD